MPSVSIPRTTTPTGSSAPCTCAIFAGLLVSNTNSIAATSVLVGDTAEAMHADYSVTVCSMPESGGSPRVAGLRSRPCTCGCRKRMPPGRMRRGGHRVGARAWRLVAGLHAGGRAIIFAAGRGCRAPAVPDVRRHAVMFGRWCCDWPGRMSRGATAASTASLRRSASRWRRRRLADPQGRRDRPGAPPGRPWMGGVPVVAGAGDPGAGLLHR